MRRFSGATLHSTSPGQAAAAASRRVPNSPWTALACAKSSSTVLVVCFRSVSPSTLSVSSRRAASGAAAQSSAYSRSLSWRCPRNAFTLAKNSTVSGRKATAAALSFVSLAGVGMMAARVVSWSSRPRQSVAGKTSRQPFLHVSLPTLAHAGVCRMNDGDGLAKPAQYKRPPPASRRLSTTRNPPMKRRVEAPAAAAMRCYFDDAWRTSKLCKLQLFVHLRIASGA